MNVSFEKAYVYHVKVAKTAMQVLYQTCYGIDDFLISFWCLLLKCLAYAHIAFNRVYSTPSPAPVYNRTHVQYIQKGIEQMFPLLLSLG